MTSTANTPSIRDLADACRISQCRLRLNDEEEDFPAPDQIADTATMKLFSICDIDPEEMTAEAIKTRLKELGYRAATLRELLLWAKIYWDQYWTVMAIGDQREGGFPSLWHPREGIGRAVLGRFCFGGDTWYDDYRLLVVPLNQSTIATAGMR